MHNGENEERKDTHTHSIKDTGRYPKTKMKFDFNAMIFVVGLSNKCGIFVFAKWYTREMKKVNSLNGPARTHVETAETKSG